MILRGMVFKVILRARNEMGPAFAGATTSLKNFSTQSQRLRERINQMAMPMIVAGGAMSGAIGKVVIDMATFERAVADAAILTGNTGKQFQESMRTMEGHAMRMAKITGMELPAAAKGMADTIQAGTELGTEGFEKLYEAGVKFAKVGAMDTNQAVETLAAAVGAFKTDTEDLGESMKNAMRYGNVMQKAALSGLLTLESLSESFQKAGPVSAAMGMSVEDTTAALMSMARVGLRGSVAATLLNQAMVQLAAPTKKARLALKAMNVEIYKEGKFRGLIPVINDINEAFKGVSTEHQNMLKSMIWGRKALVGATIIINQRAKVMQQYKDQLTGTTVLEDAFNELMKTSKERMNILNTSLGILSFTLGSTLREDVNSVLDGLTNMVDRLSAWAAANPEAVAGILKMVAGLGALTLGAGVTALAVGSLLSVFGALGFMLANMATVGAGAAFLGWTALVLAAMGTILAGAPALVQALQVAAGQRQKVDIPVFQQIFEFFEKAGIKLQEFTDWMLDQFPYVFDQAQTTVARFVLFVARQFQSLVNLIPKEVRNIFGFMMRAPGVAFEAITGKQMGAPPGQTAYLNWIQRMGARGRVGLFEQPELSRREKLESERARAGLSMLRASWWEERAAGTSLGAQPIWDPQRARWAREAEGMATLGRRTKMELIVRPSKELKTDIKKASFNPEAGIDVLTGRAYTGMA